MNNLFFTAQDSNYQIKGSRDPLGFQTIWQRYGRKLFPHITTVANNITDYIVLALAYRYRQKLHLNNQEDFSNWFLNFEQLLAYARYDRNKNNGFNGIDKVRKEYEHSANEIKIGKDNPILTKQKSSGIWGNYGSPFKAMEINEDENLNNALDKLIEQNAQLTSKAKYFKSNLNQTAFWIKKSELKEYYKTLDDALNNYQILSILKNYLLEDEYNGAVGKKMVEFQGHLDPNKSKRVFEFLVNHETLNKPISQILEVESVIGPISILFSYLQHKTVWTKKALKEDDLVNKICTHLNQLKFQHTDIIEEVSINPNTKNTIKIIEQIVVRNAAIAKNRHGLPWLVWENNLLKMDFNSGSISQTNYEPNVHMVYNYFLHSYIRLYQQLNK